MVINFTLYLLSYVLKNDIFFCIMLNLFKFLQDFINFDVYLTDKSFSSSTGNPWVVPGSFYHGRMDIMIDPLNDNPPILMTKGSVLKVRSIPITSWY